MRKNQKIFDREVLSGLRPIGAWEPDAFQIAGRNNNPFFLPVLSRLEFCRADRPVGRNRRDIPPQVGNLVARPENIF